jgi:enamine deaminase RidA (YjgF/YER057c/UK114 family)
MERAGFSLQDVVRVTYILPDAGDFEPCWPVFRKYFGETRPAATALIANLIDPRMKIEIEVTGKRRGSLA